MIGEPNSDFGGLAASSQSRSKASMSRTLTWLFLRRIIILMEPLSQTEFMPPSLPSNLPADKSHAPEFNTKGFYNEIQDRLDSQMRALESVYSRTMRKLEPAEPEREMEA